MIRSFRIWLHKSQFKIGRHIVVTAQKFVHGTFLRANFHRVPEPFRTKIFGHHMHLRDWPF